MFEIDVRVYYEDTDAGGIVYHANYLKFMERCRTEWVRSLGINQQYLLEQSIGFVVIDMSLAFKQSAKLDDMITVSCELVKAKRASLLFRQRVTRRARDDQNGSVFSRVNSCVNSRFNKNDELVCADVKVACVNTQSNKATAIPTELIKQINEIK